jgi:hypothetical protein
VCRAAPTLNLFTDPRVHQQRLLARGRLTVRAYEIQLVDKDFNHPNGIVVLRAAAAQEGCD